MTVDEVRERAEEIRQIAEVTDDPEGAHVKEDALHQDILAAIAAGAADPASLAVAGLKTNGINYRKWYA